MSEKSRLFVPLTAKAFQDFSERGKRVEIRRHERQFRLDSRDIGRRVELRKGYSGESIWGIVAQIVIGDLETIFQSFPLSAIEPRFETLTDAIADNAALLSKTNTYQGSYIGIQLDAKR